jgi:RNA polymerase sigma factor (sigma-70 family)
LVFFPFFQEHFFGKKHLSMNAVVYDNEQFVAALKQGELQRQSAIRWLYEDKELRKRVIAFVRNNQGNEEDGTDMFHEGIIVLDRNVRDDSFRGESSVKGYLFSICRFLWMNQLRKNSRITLVEPGNVKEEVEYETPERHFQSDELKTVMGQVLDQLGQQCRKILDLWKLSHSMAEIAAELGFDNDAQARKAKYRCHLSLMQLLEKNPGIMQRLKEWV